MANALLLVGLSVVGLHGGTISPRAAGPIASALARPDTAATSDTAAKKVDTVTQPMLGPSIRYGVDTTVAPCEDFYLYANGDWRNKTKIISESGAPKRVEFFSDTYKRTQKRLQTMLDSAWSVASTTKDPTIKMVGTFYGSCLTTDSLDLQPRYISSKPIPDSTRAQQCLTRSLNNVGGGVGQMFAQELLVTNAMSRMERLLESLRVSVIARIDKNPWMSVAEKKRAHERLEKLHLRVGMPKEAVDYSDLVLSSSDYKGNKQAIKKFNNKKWANSIGENDREKWKASLLVPNAFYMPGDHAIEIPAVMFMPPFFDVNAEDAANYAGIGMVIGHEIFHSIAVNLSSLENPEMKKQVERLKAFNSTLGILDGWNTDGKRTFSEDVADLGGVIVSYNAWKSSIKNNKAANAVVDGYTPDQRYFLALAQVWRAKWTSGANGDVHAAPFARVHSMVMNMPEFVKAFGCKENDRMVVSADQKAIIW